MPKNLVRYQQTGNFHFITFSCYHRQPYLGSQQARACFEQCFESMRQRYRFSVSAYVVMPEHVHLLLSEPPVVPLSTAIKALKLSVAVRNDRSPFWQKRYFDFNVRSQDKLIEKRRYIHRNPVARGLVTAPDLWPWSSFHHWATGSPGTVAIDSPWTVTSPVQPSTLRCPTSRP